MPFEVPSEPWHRSLAVIILAVVVTTSARAGPDLDAQGHRNRQEAFRSMSALTLSGIYLFLFLGGGMFLARLDQDSEAHYTDLERQRA